MSSNSSKLDESLERYKLLAERKQREAAQRRAAIPVIDQEQAPAPPIPVPCWADAVRAVPNAFLRSAIFGAIKPGVRAKLENTLMPSLEGIEVRCSGQRLDQSDLDVWMTVLHLCRGNASVSTTSYQILKSMGLTDTGKNRVLLSNRLERLVEHTVAITQGSKKYVGNLLAGAGRDDETGAFVIDTNPRITKMLDGDTFTLVARDMRHLLTGQPLALWLHAFYSTHAKPLPMRVETLHSLSGSQSACMRDFTKTLRKALDAVQKAFEKQHKKFSFKIENGLVTVTSSTTKAQLNHLNKKENRSFRTKN